MTRIIWDALDERPYELGVDRGLLHVPGNVPIPWNGLISVNETEVDGSVVQSSLDGLMYANLLFGGFYQSSVTAYGFPDSLVEVLGFTEVFPGLSVTAQHRTEFNFSYRTLIGEDDYKLHIVHNATAAQPTRNTTTITQSIDPQIFECVINALPPESSIFRPCAHLVVNTTTADPSVVSDLEDVLYGAVGVTPSFPTQQEVITMFTP
jgi:hypothetical protein